VLLGLLVLTLSLTPMVRGDATFTLYQDAQCSQPIGEPADVPFPSSPKCQTVPDQSVSFVFVCAPDGGNTNFTFAFWNETTDCSGDSTISIVSDGKAASCAAATITAQGQTFPAYITVDCGSSTHINNKRKNVEVDEDEIKDLIEDVIEDVEEFVQNANKKANKRNTVNTIIKLLKGQQ